MRVVVCDDDIGCCAEIENWLMRYAMKESRDIQVTLYHDAEKLLESMEQNQWFDAIFLDIELPEKSGVELGHRIREMAQSDMVAIVYISAKTEYCPELFEIEPLNFHQKPLKKEDILKDMDKILQRYSIGQNVLKYTENGITRGIFLRDVLYIKTKDKMAEVFTAKGTSFLIRDSLQDLHEKYEKYHLCQCHRSCVINMNHVKRYLNYTLFLEDGTEITVGRKYRDQVKNAWIEYDWRD